MTDPKRPLYTLEFTSGAIRDLERLDLHIRQKVFAGIEELREDPRPQGIRKMETKEELYRIRVGPGKKYRAIYQIRDEALLVLVVKVGHRKQVYRRVN